MAPVTQDGGGGGRAGAPDATLGELFDADVPDAVAGAPVRGITLDSRLVRPGDLYVALPGRSHHGARFAGEACAAGAVAVLTDPAGAVVTGALACPVVVAADPRHAMAGIAARIHRFPSRSMTMFAITGTNGKTTTSYLLAAALRASGRRTGLIGTIGFALDGRPIDQPRTTVTTPESPELQGLLAAMRDEGADSVVMEVSSHALVLGRADAIRFDVAAFTNFGRDHLDFHGDLESYFEAKASLFTPEHAARAVVVVDDARGAVLVERCRRAGIAVVTVSLHDSTADCRAEEVRALGAGRLAVVARVAGQRVPFELALPGDFNVRNALTALAMAAAVGIDPMGAAAGLADARVPGRMEPVELGDGAPAVFVDFAHTPQAVSAALAALGPRRRLVVLGCGGDRDPAKRRPMGEAAARSAAVVLVTDDNPRGEDPAAIRAEVLAGARAAQEADQLDCVVIDGGDRRSAIARALAMARPDDAVAILGKGHETGQEVAGVLHPFVDAAVVRDEWQRR